MAIILTIFWFVAIFVVVPFATSAVFALFYGLLVRRSTQSGIVFFSVLVPSLVIVLWGAVLVFESARSFESDRSNAGLVFLFGCVVIAYGVWSSIPGMFAGRMVARSMRHAIRPEEYPE